MTTRRTLPLYLFSLSVIFCAASFGSVNPVKLTNFKVGFSKTNPKTLTSSSSPEVGWTPIIDLKVLALRGDISIFSAKRSESSKFIVTNYEALVMLPLLPLLTIEAGGGMQNWHGQGGISPIATGGLMIRIGEVIDRLYFNYSYVFAKDNETKEFRMGIGLNF